MEPMLRGDHSASSHHLSLWGTKDGLSCPRLGVGSQSSLKNAPLRGRGLTLNASRLRARKSRFLIHQAYCHSPPCQRVEDVHAPLPSTGPRNGFLHDTAPLGLRPADGYTLPGQRTFSPRPRSGQHSGTCERRPTVRGALAGVPPSLGPIYDL